MATRLERLDSREKKKEYQILIAIVKEAYVTPGLRVDDLVAHNRLHPPS